MTLTFPVPKLLLGSPLYNLMLAIYYLLLGKHHMSEQEIATRYEPYMHATAITLSVGLAIAGLPLTLYNSANLWCWISAYPQEAESFSGHHDGHADYMRGNESWLYRWLFFYVPLWFVIVAVTAIMAVLTVAVKEEERHYIEMILRTKSDRPQNTRGSTDETDEIVLSIEHAPMPAPEEINLERSRKMFHQVCMRISGVCSIRNPCTDVVFADRKSVV